MKRILSFSAISLALLAPIASAAPFDPANVVVSRVGTAGGTLASGIAAPVFLDEYTPAGALVQSVPLPTSAVGGNAPLAVQGNSTTEAIVTRSQNGASLVLAGYAVALGASGLPGNPATINRVIGVIGANGTIDTTTRLSDAYNAGSIRSAASDDASQFWLTGANEGIRYVPFGNAAGTASTLISTTVTNTRVAGVFGSQLYMTSASAGANQGVNKVGSGLPTGSGNAATLVSGASVPSQFVFLDLNPSVPGLDTLYVANGTLVQKFIFDGSSWTAAGSASTSSTNGTTNIGGLAASVSGGTVTLFSANSTNFLKATDGSGSGALSGSFTSLVTAASGTAFRGVALTPVAGNGSSSPSGSGMAMPNVVSVGDSTLLTVSVSPGSNPASTGLAVTGNLSAIGGAMNQPFFDDGTNGDATAGDRVFSFTAVVNSGSGSVSLPISISDAQARTGNTSIALTVGTASGVTKINTIQGQTDTPLTGAQRVEGVVTAVFPNLAGFYVQEEDADADSDPLTSEGIFVNSAATVQVGQVVQVQGTVANDFGLTQFSGGASVTVMNGDALVALPAAVTPEFPLPSAVNGTAYLERFEGMRINFPGTLYVTDNFNLGRFGEVSVSPVSHLFIPTNTIDPNDATSNGTSSSGGANVPSVTAQSALNLRNKIVLDDTRDGEHPSPIPYLNTSAVGGRTLRLGDSVSNLAGILSYGFNAYRIRPTDSVTFSPTNARTAAPAPVGGNVKVTATNVLNYFTTFGGATDRGADSTAELNRQRAKIVAALFAIDADIVGFQEMQNNGTGPGSAIDDLLNNPTGGLNPTMAAAGRATYSIVPLPSDPFGSDVIKVSLIYRAARVSLDGNSVTDTANFSTYSRPPLAQLFSVNATGGAFYVCVNHFKSKGGSGATGADLDQGDGQSAYNARRKAQASALISFLSGLQANDPDVLVVGDLNAYGEEDPIDLFRAAGYIDEIGTRSFGEQPYSFLFFNEVGRLDHVLATPSLHRQITGANEWHINADEPRIIDYNLDTNDSSSAPAKPDDAYVGNAYRASDHDPAVIGIQIDTPALTLSPNTGRPGTSVVLNGPNLGSASSVRFAGDAAATFTVNSPSQITATVPAGALTGPIQVVTTSGTAVSETFRILPRITGISPGSGAVGSEVIITGSQLSSVTQVKFATNISAAFTIDSDMRIRATVPAGAVRGTIRVESPGGAATSLARFTITPCTL